MGTAERGWCDEVHRVFRRHAVRQVGYVPDAGQSTLITALDADPDIRAVSLTSEQEGIGLVAGAALGGQRATLLMQASGLGNCINNLGMVEVCRFPLFMLITMRGEFAEFNPWQCPMGKRTEDLLRLLGILGYRADDAGEIGELVDSALELTFHTNEPTAVLISQRVLGRKTWQ
jgi:sulfopyruvate decarboxylase alpha subunit